MTLVLALVLLAAPVENKAELSVGQHLTLGEFSLNNRRWNNALEHFEKAMATGRLSDAGSAMVYWNIYTCGRALYRMEKVTLGLFGFITYARIVLDEEEKYGEWVVKYKLKGRMSYARSKLDALWAERNSYSCRVPEQPCYLSNPKFIDFYYNALKFCTSDVVFSHQNTRATGKCPDGSIETYYFYHD
jgi:hypothetical protein